ncbi:MAG TPA: MBOAT family protein [Pirellulales bacterium]
MRAVRGFLPLIVLPAVVILFAPATWPPWALMWTLAFAIYCGCKWLTWRRTPAPRASWALHLGYLAAWPGMDAPAFLNVRRRETLERVTLPEWLFAALKTAWGFVVLYGIARLVPLDYPYVVGWVGMLGTALILHFGGFHLLSCAWRSMGVQARPLMNWPLVSTSVSEYWGRRWNTAFRDMTHRFLFRPLTPRLGAQWALLAGFTFSGIVHDLVISYPIGGGYGGPTVFFLLQAVGMLFERSPIGKRWKLGSGWRGWIFTGVVLLGPTLLLFHRPFVEGIVVPYMRAIGAIS